MKDGISFAVYTHNVIRVPNIASERPCNEACKKIRMVFKIWREF